MGRPPDKLIPRIFWYISVYFFLCIAILIERFYISKEWIEKKLEPKHRELNWLRKLAGIKER